MFEDVTEEELGETTRSNRKNTLSVSVTATRHTPLRRGPGNVLHTPHSPFAELGTVLPLHWHVYSTCSDARYRVEARPADACRTPGESGGWTIEGNGLAHIEKNWGRGFPEGWTCYVTSRLYAFNMLTEVFHSSQDTGFLLRLTKLPRQRRYLRPRRWKNRRPQPRFLPHSLSQSITSTRTHMGLHRPMDDPLPRPPISLRYC